jgi:hypothetical protein
VGKGGEFFMADLLGEAVLLGHGTHRPRVTVGALTCEATCLKAVELAQWVGAGG